MPLDAVTLSSVAEELRTHIIGTKIDKIYQPTRDQVVFLIRSREGALRLLLSANPASPRAHFTSEAVENPASPPMFCMLLRKHLAGGRFEAVSQPPMERVLDFSLACTDEFGDPVTKHVILEIMGRNSNLILTGRRWTHYRLRTPGRLRDVRAASGTAGALLSSAPQSEQVESCGSSAGRHHVPASAGQYAHPARWISDGSFCRLPPLICRELCYRYDPTLEDLNVLSPASRYAFGGWLKAEFQKIATLPQAPYLLLKAGSPWDYHLYAHHTVWHSGRISAPAEFFSAAGSILRPQGSGCPDEKPLSGNPENCHKPAQPYRPKAGKPEEGAGRHSRSGCASNSRRTDHRQSLFGCSGGKTSWLQKIITIRS